MASSDYALSQYIHQTLQLPVYANRTGLNPSFPCVVYSKRSSLGTLTSMGPSFKTEVFTFSVKAKTKAEATLFADQIYALLHNYNNQVFAVQSSYTEDYDELEEFWSIDNDFQCIVGATLPYFNIIRGDGHSGSIALWNDKYVLTGSNSLIVSGPNVIVSGSLTVLGDIHAAISASVESASYAATAAFALNSTPLPDGLVSSSAQVLNGSGVYSSSAQLPNIPSASYAATASYLIGAAVVPAGTVSSSAQIDYTQIQNKPTTIATASLALTASYALNTPTLPAGLVSASAQIDFNGIQNKPSSIATASYVLNAVSASYAPLPSGVVSSSAQILNGSGVYSASAQLPSGLVSASAQIDFTLIQNKPVTSSYAITASYALNSTPLPAGLFSSSAQVDYTQIQNKPTTIATASYVLNAVSASYSPLPQSPVFSSVGIGQTPTAHLHIKAGTTAAGTAPIKLTSGSLNTTPESGTIEYDGENFWLTI